MFEKENKYHTGIFLKPKRFEIKVKWLRDIKRNKTKAIILTHKTTDGKYQIKKLTQRKLRQTKLFVQPEPKTNRNYQPLSTNTKMCLKYSGREFNFVYLY